MNNILSIYGAHDSSVTFIDKLGNIRIFEYERFVNLRYSAFSREYGNCEESDENRKNFINLIKSNLGSDIDTILYNNLSDEDFKFLKKFFPNASFELMGHHLSHASSGYFTSKFDDCVILSVDGGGHDFGQVSYTNIFYAKDGKIEVIDSKKYNLGLAYGRIGSPISEISRGGGDKLDSLSYAGKVMGLCAYGNVNDNWTFQLKKFYTEELSERNYRQGDLKILSEEINLNLSYNSLSGQSGYDLATTSQYVFEEVMMDLINPHLDKSDNFILVGGCALNVLFNQKLKVKLNRLNKNLYVPPIPNDCGLSLGQFLYKNNIFIDDFVYNGINILDYDKLSHYVDQQQPKKVSIKEVVDLIKSGKIIGVINGNSEVGPRALGNRSIICDPTVKNMKDILNSKVKFREWFRPFAPVCRVEDSEIFFEDSFESEYMSYAPKVREEYREILPSITHSDGTGRLQTVDSKGHKLFYNILTELSDIKEPAVILNTSFNIKGKPILTTIEDALTVLQETELDYVLIDDYLFEKK